MVKLWKRFTVGVCVTTSALVCSPKVLAQDSIDEHGINALVLQQSPYNLTGKKIAIGQVEIGRPGLFGFDKVDQRNAAAVVLAGLFFRDSPAKRDAYVDAHAHNVASIMVSRDKSVPGVAPQARLYSAAVGQFESLNGQSEECRSANHVAVQNNGDVRAINFSFGESLRRDPRPNARLDGNALLTLCIDWSTRVHDVLYVVAGNQGRGGISIPTDNFNGINVAFTRLWNGSYSKVDFANLGGEMASIADTRVGVERNMNSRRSIDLAAPGSRLNLMNPDGETTLSSGTSFAAPHVTATVALLQEYADRQLKASLTALSHSAQSHNPWTLDARRHEVSKAVLLNAADKIQDSGNGQYLGMNRTIVDQQSNTWLESEAYRSQSVIFDLQTGAGHLNAFRSYLQLRAGQWSPEQPVPLIGWDYRTIASPHAASDNPLASDLTVKDTPSFRDYVFDQPLQGNTHMAVTLVWDRHVELIDRNGNGRFDDGERFDDRGLNNLDLYLMPADATDIRDSLWSSVSSVDSTEHLFFEIPQTGHYKIRVQYQHQANEAIQPYGLAWWAVAAE